MHLVVAANPAAGGGRRAGAGALVVARLREAGHEVVVVEAPDVAAVRRELSAAVAAGAGGGPAPTDGVVAVGGDGMVHLAVGVLAGTPVPLGVVATGTGNDIARSLGLLGADVGASTSALLLALQRAPRVLDAVAVAGAGPEHAWFAGVLSAGFDAAVNERGNALRRPRGAARYVVAVVLEVARLHPWSYRLVLDGTPRALDAVLVTVGNTTSVGGGMRLTPGALPDDGELDVLLVSPLRRGQLLRIFPRVFRGTHLGDRHVSVVRARTITVDAVPGRHAAPVAYADGERLGALPLTLTCVPGALRVFC